MRTIAFFNHRSGVGKTTLVYHVAWMCVELRQRALVIDLDPQANLTMMLLDEAHLTRLWPEDAEHLSVFSSIAPVMDGRGDVAPAPLQKICPGLHLLPGDLGLCQFEDRLACGWLRGLDGDRAAFQSIASFHRLIQQASEAADVDVVLMDVGPGLGAINRAALMAADHVVVPLAPGLFSLQGLKSLGHTLCLWRDAWRKRLSVKPADLDLPMPPGAMKPAGYVIIQHVEREKRSVKLHERWVSRIPEVYETHVLQHPAPADEQAANTHQIGLVKNHHSLMLLSEDARKPMFGLTPADGAIGGHSVARSKCYLEFKHLTLELLRRTGGNTGSSPVA